MCDQSKNVFVYMYITSATVPTCLQVDGLFKAWSSESSKHWNAETIQAVSCTIIIECKSKMWTHVDNIY